MKALAGLLLTSVVLVALPEQATAFTVTNSGLTAYLVDGASNPTLNLVRGQTYTFNVSAIGHPFYIKTTATTGTLDQYTNGVTGQGVTSGTLTFVVPTDAPNQLFYHCSLHATMGGTLNITGIVGVPPGGTPQGAPADLWLGLATPNPARDGARFSFGLPRGSSIDFSVFDMGGRRVWGLKQGVMPAGVHSIAWNGLDEAGHPAPSGLYFFLLRADDRALSGRLVLAR